MRLLARIMCALSLLVCALVGVVSLFNPTGTAQAVGFALQNEAGRAEFMTVYGGFFLGISLFLILALRRIDYLEPALAFLAIGATSIMLVRLGTWYFLRPEDPMTLRLLYSEIGWAVSGWVGWAAAWQARRTRNRRARRAESGTMGAPQAQSSPSSPPSKPAQAEPAES
jgi:hypothetical protein